MSDEGTTVLLSRLDLEALARATTGIETLQRQLSVFGMPDRHYEIEPTYGSIVVHRVEYTNKAEKQDGALPREVEYIRVGSIVQDEEGEVGVALGGFPGVVLAMPEESARLLRDFLDPTRPYVHLDQHPRLQEILYTLTDTLEGIDSAE